MNDEDGLKKLMMAGPIKDLPIDSKKGSIYNDMEITYIISLLKKNVTTYSTPDKVIEIT